MIGASWSLQLIAFLISLAFGLGGGIFALIYARKARPVERALTDFVATILIIALFLVSIEVGCDGQLAPYTLIAYILGLPVIPILAINLKRRLTKQTIPASDIESISKQTVPASYIAGLSKQTIPASNTESISKQSISASDIEIISKQSISASDIVGLSKQNIPFSNNDGNASHQKFLLSKNLKHYLKTKFHLFK